MTDYKASKRIVGTEAERTGITFEEDFTSGATDVWSHSESDETNRSGNELKHTHAGIQWSDQTNSTYDLQTSLGSGTNASDTKWVLRGKIKSTISGSNASLYFGLSDVINADSHLFGDNHIAAYCPTSSQTDQKLQVRDGTTITYSSDHINLTSGTYYWFELKRTSSTGASLKIYTSSSYSGSTIFDDDVTWSGSITGLRYIKLGKTPHGSQGSNYVLFDDIKFYNGVTDVSSAGAGNVQTNSIFEESDTGKHYIWSGSAWTEVA